MAYIDHADYVERTGDDLSPAAEVEALIGPACDIVNGLCGGGLGDELSHLDERTAEAVRRATADEVRFLLENGGLGAAMSGAVSYGGRVTIGGFSYGDGRIRDREERILLDGRICQAVIERLIPTGLLFAGVR